MLKFNDQMIFIILIIFAASLFASLISIPFINRIGLKLNIIDIPNRRKVHKGKIVRIGGLGILIGFTLGLLIFLFISKSYPYINLNMNFSNNELNLLIFGSFSFLLLGLLDDLYALSPFTRLGTQFLITSVLFSFGLNIDAIDLSWININSDFILLNRVFSYIFISIWIVGLTNAINWIDGLDGLASGVVFIQLIGISIILIACEKWEIVLISASFCGGILGFLKHNFYPAKIMMGDCGSYFLGSFSAIISIIGLTQNFDIERLGLMKVFSFHLAFLIFLLPLVDMTYVISSRIISGHSPFYPDKNHFHHKLLKRGFNQKNSVISLYLISIISISISFFMFSR